MIGIGTVRVTPATTVLELECAIAELIGLQLGDFVYISALFSSQVRESFGLGMFLSASRREADAMARIDQSRRFPIALKDYFVCTQYPTNQDNSINRRGHSH